MKIDNIKEKVKIVVDKFIKNDKEHLYKDGVHENAMSHRIAVYLEKEFKNYNIDCEYNKNLSIPKLNDKKEKIRPDIIIHKRGENKNNLVVIEIKKVGKDSQLAEKDIVKIKKMNNLGYEIGLFIGILKAKIDLCWIREGEEKCESLKNTE